MEGDEFVGFEGVGFAGDGLFEDLAGGGFGGVFGEVGGGAEGSVGEGYVGVDVLVGCGVGLRGFGGSARWRGIFEVLVG